MAKNRDLSKLANRLTVDSNYNVGISGSLSITGSLIATGTSILSGSSQLSNLGYSTTGSNTFQGNQTVNGNMVITGSLTAQQYIVSSSVTYLTESFASGSHKFGDSIDDTHQFTGSVYITGSLVISGSNAGIGVTPSAWDSSWRTIELYNQGNFVGGETGKATWLGSNNIFSGSAYKYVNANGAAQYILQSDGSHKWRVAAPGSIGGTITWNDAMFLSSSGNFGIGTITPSATLHLSSTTPLLKFTNISAGSGAGSIQFYSGSLQMWNIGTYTNNDLYFYNNTTSTYNLWAQNSTGYIGINKNSANAQLDVNGATILSGSLTVVNNTLVMSGSAPYMSFASTNAARTYLAGVDSNGYIIYDNGASAYRMILSPAGNFGIGAATPADIIDVRKNQNATTNFYFRNTDTTNANSRAYLNVIAGDATISLLALHGGDTYIAGTSGRNMYFQQNPGGTVNMFISSGGNVGIGVTNPTNKLQVNGNLYSNNIKNFSLTLQGTGTPVNTGLPINAYGGGRCYLLLTSQQWDAGNSTSAVVTMIRCGYDGNNFSAVVLGSSQLQAETWSQSGGYLYVAGNTNFQLNIIVLSNN